MPHTLLSRMERCIAEFMQSPANDLGMAEPEPAFEMPLLGVAAGDDPLWLLYQGNVVAPFHWTPVQAFSLGFPEQTQPAPEELSVLSWVLPQTAATRAENRREHLLPGERWARARILGEERVNNGLRRMLTQWLAAEGIQAVAPVLLEQFRRDVSPSCGYASTWSERHVAHAAGLGTFGLSDGLITAKGKAIRVGSVVLRHVLPPTPRPYTSHREYCLFFSKGTCGQCAKRCPADSVRPEGRDKERCLAYSKEHCRPYIKTMFGLDGPGCGLCQVGVPCESGIPR